MPTTIQGLAHHVPPEAPRTRIGTILPEEMRERFTTDVERVLFALVANRAIDPASKLAAAEWASNDVAISGFDVMDDDQAYRAMDLLVAADAQAQVQEAVFFLFHPQLFRMQWQ